MTLYHLISEQVWQNLLPVLALRPARVVQVYSAGIAWEQRAKALESAAREAGLTKPGTVFIRQALPSAFPDLETTQAALGKLHRQVPADVLNFTGGTKLMSIGAHAFAREAGVPSFYFDSRNGPHRFDGGTGELPEMPPILEQAGRVSVRVALAAAGWPLEPTPVKTAKPEEVAFGLQAAALWERREWGRLKDWLNAVKKQRGFDENKNKPLYDGRFHERPLPPATEAITRAYADAAVEAGILQVGANGEYYLAPERGKFAGSSKALEEEARQNFQMLEGGWWELYVLEQFRKNPAYSDVVWSVEIPGNSSRGETDVVGFNRSLCCLDVISCKKGVPPKSLQHCEGLRQRAREIGGNYARAFLAVYQKPSASSHLAEHCQATGVTLLSGPSLNKTGGRHGR